MITTTLWKLCTCGPIYLDLNVINVLLKVLNVHGELFFLMLVFIIIISCPANENRFKKRFNDVGDARRKRTYTT